MTTKQRLTWERLTLKLRNPFRLSYGVDETRTSYWIRLADDEGWGEGTIPSYYHIPWEAILACWQEAANQNRAVPDDPQEFAAWIPEGPAPARCALEIALYDRAGRQKALPLYQLLGLPPPEPMPTSFTIAIASPQEMAELARSVPGYPVIKVKLGSDDDEARLRAIREARPDARLRVDANAGWTPDEAVRRLDALEPLGLEMVEQPVPKEDIAGMGYVQKHASVPVVADESVQTEEAVERLAEAGVQGINLKLMKLGGISTTLRLLQRARQLGLKTMLGCMIETSLGTTAMAHLAGLADWIDLDGPMLISNDPFDGLAYDAHANLTVPDRPGIGVRLREPQLKEPRLPEPR
jgi:L-alanine-DL-glutamate epimerase-like enolase superfamily enzyme